MNNIIELFRKELIEIACLKDTTVRLYVDIIYMYFDYRQTIYEVSSQTTRSNLIDLNLFKDYLKKQKCNRITGETVMGFQMYLKKKRLNTGSSINRKLFSLRSYGSYLQTLELDGTEKLPFKDILKIRLGYSNGPQALTVDQVKRFFKYVDNKSCLGIRDYCVYACMYNLGLRIGEVHDLNVNDIDFKAKKLTVIGKGKKRRTLFLTDEMRQIITDWLTVRQHFLNSDKIENLFISKKGNPLSIRTMEDNFKKILKASKINTHFNVTPHTLRHSFASHLNDKDVDILILQSLPGHSTPRSTEIYIHPSEKRVKDALEKLPAVKYINRLIETGALRFQKGYRKKLCVKLNKRKMKILSS